MKTKHTKGKWGAVKGVGRFLISSNLDASNKNSICATAEDTPTDKANAKLIASAPQQMKRLIENQRMILAISELIKDSKVRQMLTQQYDQNNRTLCNAVGVEEAEGIHQELITE